jgi:SPP1 gp7 family putative phage head morphogenesis protein
MPNQVRSDPTRMTLERKRFERDIQNRFDKIRVANWKYIYLDNTLLLEKVELKQLSQFEFATNPQKLRGYQRWLKNQIDQGILSVDSQYIMKPWLAPYIESAHLKGMVRAYYDVRKKEAGFSKSPNFYQGGKQEFLRSAFAQPVLASKVELLYTRAYEQLKGITNHMSQQLSRTLAEGMAEGKGPRAVATKINQEIKKITKKRALVLARTELANAHAEGQLDGFELLGVEELGIMAEWLTAGDDRVCPDCGALEGEVFSMDEARGMLPLHPNCRCAWIPYQQPLRKQMK